MADEDVVERVVGKGQLHRIGLEHARVAQAALGDFLAALAQHAAGEVNADNSAVLRIKI